MKPNPPKVWEKQRVVALFDRHPPASERAQVVAECLAEFDIPVAYRPSGWTEKADALRERSASEVKAAIRALARPREARERR
jgi:hypothetical protein